jgi:hypothetical protein
MDSDGWLKQEPGVRHGVRRTKSGMARRRWASPAYASSRSATAPRTSPAAPPHSRPPPLPLPTITPPPPTSLVCRHQSDTASPSPAAMCPIAGRRRATGGGGGGRPEWAGPGRRTRGSAGGRRPSGWRGRLRCGRGRGPADERGQISE